VVAPYNQHGERVRLCLQVLPEVSLRRVSIKRLLTNLIENALRYGGDAVEVAASLGGEETAPYLVLSVLDRGQGIDPADWHRSSIRSFVVIGHEAGEVPGWAWRLSGVSPRYMAAASTCATVKVAGWKRGSVCPWACCCRATPAEARLSPCRGCASAPVRHASPGVR